MTHNRNALRLFMYALVAYCLIAIGGGIVWQTRFEETYFPFYPLIPAFYVFMGVLFLFLLIRKGKENGKETIKYIFGLRGIKFILSLIMLIGFVKFRPEDAKTASWTLLFFYLISLFMETTAWVQYEKEKRFTLKKELKNEL